MAAARVGVLREATPGERRVALTPDVIRRLRDAGLEVFIESGAGDAAWYPDDDYAQVGATIVDAASVRENADVLLCVQSPPTDQLRDGQVVIGLLAPLLQPELMRELAVRKITAISLDGLPRTLTRAQSMDALSSQASVAGYRAVLVAAEPFRPVLSAADHRGRHVEAGHRARTRRRRRRPAGDRHRPPARRRRQRLRRAAGGASRGGVARRQVHRADVGRVAAAGAGGYARALTDEEQAASRPSWPSTSPATTS